MKRTLNGVTLLELIITVIFIGLIVLTLTSINLFTQHHLLNSERRAKIQNEAALLFEHMNKYIVLAVGNAVTNPAVKAYSDNKGIRIRIDSNADGQVDATDAWVAYRHENIGTPVTDSEIRFYPNATDNEVPQGGYNRVAHKVVISSPAFYGLEFLGNFDGNNLLRYNMIEIRVTCRWESAQDISVDNPEFTLHTQIRMPSVSLN